MIFPLIIYYGTPGLESQVFQSYMASSGYKVQVVTTREGVYSALDANPTAITVVALQDGQDTLLEHARRVRARMKDPNSQVFLLATEPEPEAGAPGVVVIPRPYRLSELVRRIQALTRHPSAP